MRSFATEGRARKLLPLVEPLFGLALVLCVTGAAYLGGLLQPLNDGLAQLRFELLKRPASQTLTVVEIDVSSLRAAGTWPWSRARFARAVENLKAAGADVVAFDVDFSAESANDADGALEAAIRSWQGSVILPTFVQSVSSNGVRRVEGTNPLAALAEEAVLASVNVPVDPDGRVRRYHYGFAAAEGDRGSMGAVLAGRPVGRLDTFLIDYGIQLDEIERISFEAAYAGAFDPTLVRGRKILIGATAIELGDEFATAKRGTLPGVYVHALAYESLHAGRALRELKPPVLLILAGAIAFLLRPRARFALAGMLRRHVLVASGAILLPLAVQGAFPISLDTSPILFTQVLCLCWVTRAELKRRAQAVVEAREAHLLQLASHMRQSRDKIRAANKKLKKANLALDKALKARTEFLASTSHEIRTPLNGIMGMSQVILADPNLPEGLRAKVDVVHGAGETMLALIDDILDMAKIETGNLVIAPAEMDLHKLLGDAVRLWCEKAGSKGVELRASYDAAPDWIFADSTRLRQIVFNLMSNAIKFTDAGEVAVLARIEATRSGEMLLLEVSDSGIGIPAEKLDEIFQAFRQVDGSVTRTYGGTGLGLAISRQLAVAMGGDLTVRSELGRGSVFTVRMPLTRVARQAVESRPASLELSASLKNSSLLLVEANPLAQSMLKAALGEHVASIEVANSVDQALSVLSARRMDLVLADGKSLNASHAIAAEAVGRLKTAAVGARLAVLWAGAEDELPDLTAAGAQAVVRKPISAADLLRELKAFCEAPQDQAQPLARRKHVASNVGA